MLSSRRTLGAGEKVILGDLRKYLLPRKRLIEQLERDGICDARVLKAMLDVPRHAFMPEVLEGQAYQDVPLPIGEGQTISAPGIVALMSQSAELTGKERVLEIGTGSGYQAAILSQLASEVVSIERIPKLAAFARSNLDRLGISNVVVHLGDGSRGRPQQGPYDVILITAGGPEVPKPLLDQLKNGGRLIGPFGSKGVQRLLRVRREDDCFEQEVLAHCQFVDLIGEHAWKD